MTLYFLHKVILLLSVYHVGNRTTSYYITNMTIHKINFFLSTLKDAPQHQKLFTHIKHISEMQEAFMEVIPHQLIQLCSLGNFTGGKLTIIVRNGAVAAKLKQILPSLLSKFHKSGYVEVTAIQITVQANYYTYHADNLPREKPKISQAGTESLNKLATNLPLSPLKTAITSILKNQIKPKKVLVRLQNNPSKAESSN